MVLMITTLTAAGQGKRWKYMGERLVNDRIDHDVIMVTAARGALVAQKGRNKSGFFFKFDLQHCREAGLRG